MPTANFGASRSRIAGAMVKTESTYGSDPTPAAATDDLLIFDSPTPWTPQINNFEFRSHGSSFTRAADIVAQRFSKVRMNTMMQGSGSAGTITVNGFTALAAVLKSCGIYVATPAGTPTSIAMLPATIAQLSSSTIYTLMNGFTQKSLGCFGNCVMSGNPRSGVTIELDMTGLYAAPVAASTTWDNYTGGTNRARPWINIGGTINNGAAYSAIFKSFRFDMGATIETIDNGNDANGVESVLYADRNPMLDLVVAMDTYASAAITFDEWYTDLFSAGPTTHRINWALGSAAGNTCTFTFPTAQLINATPQANGGHREVALRYKLQSSAQESEFAIIVT